MIAGAETVYAPIPDPERAAIFIQESLSFQSIVYLNAVLGEAVIVSLIVVFADLNRGSRKRPIVNRNGRKAGEQDNITAEG